MRKEPFLTHPTFGELRILDVFVQIDYPKVFVCEDVVQTKYLFYEIDSEYEFDSWLAVRVSNKRYYDLITHQVGIVTAFTNAEENRFHTITHYYTGNRTEQKENASFDRSLLSTEDFHPSKLIEINNDDKLLEESLELGSTLIDFRLFPNNHSIKDVEVGFLTSLCNKIKVLINAVNPLKSVKPRVSTHPGSFIIRFNLNDYNNLFIDEPMASTVDKIHQLLSAENRLEINSILNSSKMDIDNYRGIINLLNNNNTDIEITSATPSSPSILTKHVSLESIKKMKNDLDNFSEETKHEESFTGILIAVDIKKRKFSFTRDNQKDMINGSIPKEFNQIFEVPNKYEIQIEIKEQFIVNDSDRTTLKKEIELKSIRLILQEQ